MGGGTPAGIQTRCTGHDKAICRLQEARQTVEVLILANGRESKQHANPKLEFCFKVSSCSTRARAREMELGSRACWQLRNATTVLQTLTVGESNSGGSRNMQSKVQDYRLPMGIRLVQKGRPHTILGCGGKHHKRKVKHTKSWWKGNSIPTSSGAKLLGV